MYGKEHRDREIEMYVCLFYIYGEEHRDRKIEKLKMIKMPRTF